LTSDQPTALAGSGEDQPPRRGLWIFHIEDRPDHPRMWTTVVEDVGRRAVEAETEFRTEAAATAHLEAFIRQAIARCAAE
jgi:hypothetical protein